MAAYPDPDNYPITSEAASYMEPRQYRYHTFHYKDGSNKFYEWIKAEQNYTHDRPDMNYLLVLAQRFVRTKQGALPDYQLYSLQKWLRGRQVCYCSHLLEGNAGDSHLHPIRIAMQLILIFMGDKEGENIISGCTPVNLHQLVKCYGTTEAQEMYLLGSPYKSDGSGGRQRSPTRTEDEREEKRRRMTAESWRSNNSSATSLTSASTTPPMQSPTSEGASSKDTDKSSSNANSSDSEAVASQAESTRWCSSDEKSTKLSARAFPIFVPAQGAAQPTPSTSKAKPLSACAWQFTPSWVVQGGNQASAF